MKRPNLRVEIRVLAYRVAMEGNRAVGIDYLQNGLRHRARARREVILCGGSINSPQILQPSGIGPGALLQSVGVTVVHDLADPGAWTMNEVYHRWLRRIYHRAGFAPFDHDLKQFRPGLNDFGARRSCQDTRGGRRRPRWAV